jgi:iron complex transport system ATP-binding protein
MSTPTLTTDTVPAIRSFDVEVASVHQLSPCFRRVTFTGPDLEYFGTDRNGLTLDLRVKLVIPSPGHQVPDFSELDNGWYQKWLALDASSRGYLRTYTVRALRSVSPGRTELDIDFVLHLGGASGPAARWAANAATGDRMTLIGPNALAGDCLGIEFKPGGFSCAGSDEAPAPAERVTAANERPAPGNTTSSGAPAPTGTSALPDPGQRVLLVGDETAVPAIGAILAALPDNVTGTAIIEVPSAADFLDLPTRSQVQVRWLARNSAQHGMFLQQAVRQVVVPAWCHRGVEPEAVDVDESLLWETPEPGHATWNGFYAWIAGEAAVVRELRRYLVRDVGVDRRNVAFMGYWRQGKAERS